MIRDFNIAEKEEDISYYAGFVGSAYMIGRALTSIFWGMCADRYGRKPVIIIGTSTVFVSFSHYVSLIFEYIVLLQLVIFFSFSIIFNTLFGFSVNYWMAIITRFLLGSLNGLLGPIRAYACELFREEHQALGLSSVGFLQSLIWSAAHPLLSLSLSLWRLRLLARSLTRSLTRSVRISPDR
ncbi:putative major facilitator superfamily, MFS transporter superfamily [Helianthus annuus]|nr:putative major facilitator superfamily, MFS transporter superfamily [Helianthus annuus]